MLGEAIKVSGDHRPWRMLEITDGSVKLIFDDRSNPKFRWELKKNLSFKMRHGISWPVHSIDGICKAIRHTNFAPGDLFLDARQGKVIRPLSHLEKWRLTGLSVSKADELVSAGFDDQLGPLAGNSIPVRMTSAVAEDEAGRIKAYKELLRSRATGGFVLMPPVAALASKSLCATFLIFVGLNAANVLVWGDGLIPGMVHDVSQQQAFEKACKWAGELSHLFIPWKLHFSRTRSHE